MKEIVSKRLVDPPVLDEDGIKTLNSIKLMDGKAGGNEIEQRKMCVMQAHAYITGQSIVRRGGIIEVPDHPICASRVITDLMIDINDYGEHLNGKYGRQTLKRAIPYNMGTAPVLEITYDDGSKVSVTDKTTLIIEKLKSNVMSALRRLLLNLDLKTAMNGQGVQGSHLQRSLLTLRSLRIWDALIQLV